jgi:hypothetical protein
MRSLFGRFDPPEISSPRSKLESVTFFRWRAASGIAGKLASQIYLIVCDSATRWVCSVAQGVARLEQPASGLSSFQQESRREFHRTTQQFRVILSIDRNEDESVPGDQ